MKRLPYLLLLSATLMMASCGRTAMVTNDSATLPVKSDTQMADTAPALTEPAPTATVPPTPVIAPKSVPKPAPESESDSAPPSLPTLPPDFKDNAVISEDGTTVTVHNDMELIFHMASDRNFLLAPGGEYDLNSLDGGINPSYFDGSLMNLENVTIEGIGDEQVDFFTHSTGKSVISFHDCSNITLKNLNLGHDPLPEYKTCEEGVIYLERVNKAAIDNCTMFGCGTVGLYAISATDLLCRDSLIRDCSLDVMELYGIRNTVFENCDFINTESEAIRINNPDRITLKNCRLVGIFSSGVPFFINETDIPDIQSADVINREISGVNFVNVTVIGNPLEKDLEKLHDGLSVTVNSERDPMGGALVIRSNMLYSEPLEESEYLQQIYTAKDLVIKNIPKAEVILVYLQWPGMEQNIMMTYYGTICLRNNYNDIAKVMNDGRDYLSPNEAEAVLKEWMPPLRAAVGMEKADEVYSFELIDTIINGDDAYYAIYMSSDKTSSQE